MIRQELIGIHRVIRTWLTTAIVYGCLGHDGGAGCDLEVPARSTTPILCDAPEPGDAGGCAPPPADDERPPTVGETPCTEGIVVESGFGDEQ